MGVLHASTFPDIHLCCIYTSGLEETKGIEPINTVNTADLKSYISGTSCFNLEYTHESCGRIEKM